MAFTNLDETRKHLFGRSYLIALMVLLLCTYANAQSSPPEKSATDGSTPLGLSPGAPAGSYALSGFENVNLFNGNLNFHLPLIGVGGRGGAAMTSMLEIDSKSWSIGRNEVPDPNDPPNTMDVFTPKPNPWVPKPGYRPGILVGRHSGQTPNRECQNPGGGVIRYIYQQTLTRLTFTTSDGTEYEFRDQLTAGQPAVVTNPCAAGASRGTVFVTADGTAATFISDSVIYDKPQSKGGFNTIFPSGYLMLRDGTRYRIDMGNVTWMRDRNGNQLTFATSTNQAGQTVYTISDSLKRQVTVTYGYPTASSDEIRYQGFGGVTRTILLSRTALTNALRAGYAPQSYGGLFPDVYPITNANTSFNPQVFSSVTLPTGQQYQFQYNSYGELARVVLPTGGAIEFDYTPTSGAVFDGTDYQIYRRVVERRVYPNAGTGNDFEQKTTYSTGANCSAPPCSGVTVDHWSSAGTRLSREKHYFHGDALASLFETSGISYAPFNQGKEYQTEAYDSNGTTLLRRTNNAWQQGVIISPWAPEISNNPRIGETTTTIEPAGANLVSKQTFSYDDNLAFNNQTDVYEYDFGVGGPGGFLRRTHTDYVTGSDYVNGNVDPSLGPHLRSLKSGGWVSSDTGGLNKVSLSSAEYDNYSTGTYHAALTPRPSISGLCTLVISPTQCDNDSPAAAAYVKRGNVTATTQYLLNSSGSVIGSISAYAQYDVAGNVVRAIDARGYPTDFDFTDRFGTPDGEARANGGSVELGAQMSYAFATRVTNALGHTAYTQFDYSLGRPVDAEDANGTTYSGYSDNELLDRTTRVIGGANQSGSLQSQTTYHYDDANHTITTTSDFNSFNDAAIKTQLLYDGLGRTVETRTYENSTQYIAVRLVPFLVQQDPDNTSVWLAATQSSNPFRPYLNEQPVWTTQFSDALGRTTKVRTPDTAIARTSYSGNAVTFSDQLGKARKSISDALGRLKEVYEDPSGFNYLTSYNYDLLDNLKSVSQGVQMRTFEYDSLKRLTSATNPESGRVEYQYDNNGNVLVKKDARDVSTHLSYDALNRPVRRWYNGSSLLSSIIHNSPALPSGVGVTAEVNFVYDSQSLAAGAPTSFARGSATGRLVAVTYGGGSAGDYYGYDALGRGVVKFQQTGATNYKISAVYNNGSAKISETYPSDRTVNHAYDGAGRTSSVTGNLGGSSRSYSSGIVYSSLGGMAKEQFGTDTPIFNKLFYNIRGQLAEIRESTSYTGPQDETWNRGAIINHYSDAPGAWGAKGGGADNNGNLRKQEVYVPLNDQLENAPHTRWWQHYDYDNLNRLNWVRELNSQDAQLWKQEFSYDRYGNRSINASGTTQGVGINSMQATVVPNTTSNRLYAPGETEQNHPLMNYDAAGNQTKDQYTDSANGKVHDHIYDAENRIKSSTTTFSSPAGTLVSSYIYDANGRRVGRTINGVETRQIYGMDGELLAEYAAADPGVTSPQKEYGYRNGQLLISADASALPPTPIFSDNFNDNSLDLTKWTVVDQNSPLLVTEQGQQLRMTPPPNTATYNGVFSNSTYDMRGKTVQVEVSQVISQAGWCENFLQVVLDSQNYYLIDVGSGSMVFRSMSGGVNDQLVISYDPTALPYWRIRHDQSQNTITFETSSNGTNWTTRKTVAATFSLTAVRFYLMAGAWGTGNGNPGSAGYDNFQLLQSGVAPAPVTNVALNKPATQISTYSDATAARAVDGNTNGAYWSGSVTHTVSGTQDWWQVDLGSTYALETIKVWNRTDCCGERLSNFYVFVSDQPFSSYDLSATQNQAGVSSYYTAGQAGSPTFVNVNRTGRYVRVQLSAAGNPLSLAEVEVMGSTVATATINWLVTDQLGTPRMVFDQTGARVNAKRHDYLPFGEELSSGQGLRASTPGYGALDGIRQKFTGYERDAESGLDFAQARYYGSMQGRFTSADPLMASARPGNPQTWNRYSYAFNNPLRFTDPSGMVPGDFYNEDGKKLGTDGLNDGKIYVVPNDAAAKQIQATDKQGGTTAVSSVASAVELPSLAVRQEIGAAVGRSNSATTDDTKGGFHEEGGVWGTVNGAERIVPAAAGAYADPQVDSEASINVFQPANPSDAGVVTQSNAQGTYHIHPKGKIEVTTGPQSKPGTVVIGGTTTTTTYSFGQPPSARDISNASSRGIGTNVVVGAGDKKAYVHNGSGVRATIKLDTFLKMGSK